MEDGSKKLRWQNLSGEERYRVVELWKQGKVEMKELCQTFGVSRQTLYRALERADQASVEALTPKRRGRKPAPASHKHLREVQSEKANLEEELLRMTQRYEIAQALLDLQRKAERGERLPGEKKTSRAKRRSNPRVDGRPGTTKAMAGGDDGAGAGSEDVDSGSLEPPSGDLETS
jgi:transposase